jgi:hypothetical protein
MKRGLVTYALLYALCIALVSLFWQRPMALSLGLILVAILMIYRWHQKSDLIIFFVALVLGPAGEAIAVYFGAWKYAKSIFLIPVWLPFLWGTVVLFFKKLCDTLLVKQ